MNTNDLDREHIRRRWHPSAVCLFVPLCARGDSDDSPWCLACVPVDRRLVKQLAQISRLTATRQQTGWIAMELEGVFLLHQDGRWVSCHDETTLSAKVFAGGFLSCRLEGALPGGWRGWWATSELIDLNDLLHHLDWELSSRDRSAGRPWCAPSWFEVDQVTLDERPVWFGRNMPGAIWPALKEWELPDPVGTLRPDLEDGTDDPLHVALGVYNLRTRHRNWQRIAEPWEWPPQLPVHLTQPGPDGWANFPEATVTFFHPLGETLAPPGDSPASLAEAPTLDMPATVRVRASAIEVTFGDLPTFVRGRPLRPFQYEVEELPPFTGGRMQGTLSLSPCNQVLEGRWRESYAGSDRSGEGMWVIRLGPRRDDALFGDVAAMNQRMRLWHAAQRADPE